MQLLSKELLQSTLLSRETGLDKHLFELPERAVQFGEGNFLRAFVDWMLHRLNIKGYFNGRVVVIQPIEKGTIAELNEQDGLYTIIQRGLQDGKPVEATEIITSISRGINPYEDWEGVLKCAEDPNIEYIFSNTTEAGIDYDPEDSFQFEPPQSFPGKLTVYLHHRFRHFNGEPSRGMIIIPCELIDKNGDTLKRIVLQLAKNWNYPKNFIEWILNNNQFLNSLVDRVVPGFPKTEIDDITESLGYEDKLLCISEFYHLWVIEGSNKLGEKLPFNKVGLNVIWPDDLTAFRTRKVRILNGAHSASVPGAYLYGVDMVNEMMEHEILGRFTKDLIYEEVISSIDNNQEVLEKYAGTVFERFANPYIKHNILSILLNSTSKYKTRVLPSILEYHAKFNILPKRLIYSLALLISLYKDGIVHGIEMIAKRDKGNFVLEDDLDALKFFEDAWRGFDGTQSSLSELSFKVLGNEKLWGTNLNEVQGLTDMVSMYLHGIVFQGVKKMYEQFIL